MFPVLIKIGPLTIHTYGFMIATAFLLGLWLALRQAAREGLSKEKITLSCAGGIFEERSRGLSVVVASVIGPAPGAEGPTRRLGADVVSLGLPETQTRLGAMPFHALLDEDSAEHLARVEEAGALLHELVRRVQPRHVYAPLAVWAHPDHRVTHQAARQVLETRAGRDVFLYEERPAALIPGAVPVRLSQLGARLPPAAAEFSDDAGLERHVLGLVRNRWVRQHFTGFVDGLHFTRGGGLRRARV